jgi:hypothetical protein
MYYRIEDLGPQAFRRAYVSALFAENKRWTTAIEKYQMVVAGSPKNSRDKARDLAAKESLAEQVSPDTYEDRKAFYEAWKDASCCADDCEQYCDECLNRQIQYKSVPTFGLDADVRRYITKYWRYQTTSELKEDEYARNKKSTGTVLSGVCNRKSDNDALGNREQKGNELFGEPAQVPGGQSEGVEAMLLSPFGEDVVT